MASVGDPPRHDRYDRYDLSILSASRPPHLVTGELPKGICFDFRGIFSRPDPRPDPRPDGPGQLGQGCWCLFDGPCTAFVALVGLYATATLRYSTVDRARGRSSPTWA
ncbi:hypothetical protein BO71DRAFT_400802 [Aspergillus ellipticus CBS 707.79]|uniref:Uncharacterized protein n=1 Tax=Aspergillus ellipticus CBS 707.79 TaxID=1448320 RepID=A0A319D4A1_9EURO|nr:hypothetical protein BO71DRAFT_400802 [Aspergillus ellipticus CBS 707.79]